MSDDEWKLKPHPTISTPTRDAPLLVIVLDGWGEAPDAPDNAISQVPRYLCSELSHGSHACIMTNPWFH